MIFTVHPADGYTPEEMAIKRQLVINTYYRINNPENKFIIMAHIEMGYKQSEIAQMFGCSQANISKKINRIIGKLRKIGIKKL